MYEFFSVIISLYYTLQGFCFSCFCCIVICCLQACLLCSTASTIDDDFFVFFMFLWREKQTLQRYNSFSINPSALSSQQMLFFKTELQTMSFNVMRSYQTKTALFVCCNFSTALWKQKHVRLENLFELKENSQLWQT